MFLLDDLREKFKARPLALGGGRDEAGICASVVKILGGTSIVLGSGVAIAPRWVLTAAHLFRVPQSLVRVQTGRLSSSARAVAIHWRTASYRFGTEDQWPDFAINAGGTQDALVLIELDADLDLQGRPARLPQGLEPTPGQSLFVVGFGLDESGLYDHEGVPRFAQMIYGGTDKRFDYRGVALRDNTVMAAGMPSSDDSGGPVYMCNWSSLDFRQIVGIHSSRGRLKDANGDPKAPPEYFARFIPLTKGKEAWINKVMQDGTRRSVPPPRPGVIAAAAGKLSKLFNLRKAHNCLTLVSDADLDGQWRMHCVSGTPLALYHMDRVVIGVDPDGQRRLRVYRCTDQEPTWEAELGPQSAGALVDDAWIEGPCRRVKGPKLTGRFYVYRRSDGSKERLDPDGVIRIVPTRRLHIDFYIDNSTHELPHKTVSLGWMSGEPSMPAKLSACPKSTPDLSIIRGEFEDDQDDEGDGYED